MTPYLYILLCLACGYLVARVDIDKLGDNRANDNLKG